jgi:hypothetical protein
VAAGYVWTLWKGENTLPLPRFPSQFTQPVTWSQISDMSKRAIHCVVLRAHAYWNITLPPTPTPALRQYLIRLYLCCKKTITNQIFAFTALPLNFHFVSPLHPTYFRFIRPPISPIHVAQSALHGTAF